MFQAKLLLFLVKGVCQIKTKKKEKKLKEQKQQERKQKKKKKRKKKSQLIKDRRKEKENRKQKQVPWTRQCLNNVQNCRKGKRRAIVAWLRHGGCKGWWWVMKTEFDLRREIGSEVLGKWS